MRYILATAVMMTAGFVGGVAGWWTGVAMNRKRSPAPLERFLMPCLMKGSTMGRRQDKQLSLPAGRFSFPVQSDQHWLTVLRYVEPNPVRAPLVVRAEQRRWGSAWARRTGAAPCRLVTPRDPALPRPWLRWVNEPQTDDELQALRNCLRRDCPFEDDRWATRSAARLDLRSTVRPRGRSQKES
jgi:hypothetical protein